MALRSVSEQKVGFPVLMESPRRTVFLFTARDFAVCVREGKDSLWKLGEVGYCLTIGMRQFEGVIKLEND